MPELPEVETMRRSVLAAVGCKIQAVEKLRTTLKPILVKPGIPTIRKRVKQREIVAAERIGKRVALRLETGDRLVFEPRMTGLLVVSDPPDIDHLRFRADLSGGTLDRFWFWDRRGLGSVRLLSLKQFDEQIVAQLGPDALALSSEQLREKLRRSRRAIKVALLDQRAVAGIGNLYASEILNTCGTHPAKRCDRLTRAEWQAIHGAMLDVLHDAIKHEGSTLSDGTYRNALNNSGGYQNYHRVYGRDGEVCGSCGEGVVERIVQAQRSTFFCPVCQAKRKRSG